MPDGQRLIPPGRLAALQAMAADGVAEGALFELPCAEMMQLLRHIDVLGKALRLEAGDYCLLCGCTQHTPCTPPCGWAAEGLCSACRWYVLESDDGDGWIVVDRITGESVKGPVDAEVYDEDGDADDCGGEVVWIKREDAEEKCRELNAATAPEDVPGRERLGDGGAADRVRLLSLYHDQATEIVDIVSTGEDATEAEQDLHREICEALADAHEAGFADGGVHAVAVCVHCEAIATQADEDRCCLTCGCDLVVCTDDVGADALLSFLAEERDAAGDDTDADIDCDGDADCDDDPWGGDWDGGADA